ncbi:hypothetical protein F5Y03DRAFT_371092 [Xylaria venustula]|nr:hypothetical protein F5Y03DRAFT_371092 [Xylaria venustula]
MRTPRPRTGIGLLSKHAWSQTLSRVTSRTGGLRVSPNRILALRLRSQNDDQKKRYRGLFRYGASVRSGRLPILTLQTWLARQDLSSEGRLATSIGAKKEADWKDALNVLAGRGWTKEDLDHWIWILSGENGDARVQRFVSTDARKPIFMLFLLLRSDETFREVESLSALIDFATRHHIFQESTTPGPQLDRRKILTVNQFLILTRRLIHHVQRVHPQSIVKVARLVAHYIESIPKDPHHKHHRTDYHHQCAVFNTALLCLRKPARIQPVANMAFNWRAQKVLLAVSDSLDRPLVINKASYRAIRQVLVGLKKSREERAVALRYAKSWPPYRQDFDGRDTKRTVEDDRSRSVKAGVLMQEAGYQADHYDRALDALGGMSESEGTPTIQTRSLPPKQWMNEKEELNIYSNWAMNVRATRNSQEAWRAFNKFGEKNGLAPTLQVYNEMFLKLNAAPVNPDSGSALLPGDSRETFPVHDANYSQYELARLSPPTVSELYAEMINRGIRPGSYGLHSLVANARSIEEGLRYLQDSGIPHDVVNSIGLYKLPSFQALRQIPLLCFNSYIHLLCRLQPDHREHDTYFNDELYPIRHAIKLASMRLAPNTTEGRTFRPPWHSILRALSRARIAVENAPAPENDLESLKLFLRTFESASSTIGIDSDLFMLFCRAIQKAALSRLRSLSDMERLDAPLIPYKQDLLNIITTRFSALTAPLFEDMPTSLPVSNFQFPLGPPLLHAYMRALAFLEARDEMTALLVWMLDNYRYLAGEGLRLGNRGQAMIAKTFCAFHSFAEPALEEDTRQELMDRMERLIADGGNWRWPTAEEVEDYLHVNGEQEQLQQRIRARSRMNTLHSRDTLEAVAT